MTGLPVMRTQVSAGEMRDDQPAQGLEVFGQDGVALLLMQCFQLQFAYGRSHILHVLLQDGVLLLKLVGLLAQLTQL